MPTTGLQHPKPGIKAAGKVQPVPRARRECDLDASPKPTSIYAYVDKLQVWLRDPIPEKRLRDLRAECGKGGLDDRNGSLEPASFDPRFRQRLQFNQPGDAVFRSLAGRDDVLTNYTEFGLDWVFPDVYALDDALSFFAERIIKQNHGDQRIAWAGKDNDDPDRTMFYTGGRKAPNRIAGYADEACRLTGEPHCLHIEWRVKGRKALNRIKVHSPLDLIGFDHRAFWADRLLFATLDVPRLGQIVNNATRRSKRRGPWVERCGPADFAYDFDRSMGGIVMHACGGSPIALTPLGVHRSFLSVQNVIDDLRASPATKGVRVEKALRFLDVHHLLPT